MGKTITVEIIRPSKPTPKPPPDLANIYTVKPDQLSWSWDYKVRSVVSDGFLPSAPAVNRTGDINNPARFSRSTFTRAWQYFTIDLLSMSIHGALFKDLWPADKDVMIKKWSAMYDKNTFLTNFAGVGNCNNYITGEMRGEDPKIDPLICATSKVKVLEIRRSNSGITAGYDMARLAAFDEKETPPPVTMALLNDPRIMTATVIYPNGSVIDFPQYPSRRHPYPLISSAGSERWFPLIDLDKYSPTYTIIRARERSFPMLETLKGWKTYIVFLVVLLNGVLAQFGWGLELPDAWQGAASILLSILALFMRTISDGPAGFWRGKG